MVTGTVFMRNRNMSYLSLSLSYLVTFVTTTVNLETKKTKKQKKETTKIFEVYRGVLNRSLASAMGHLAVCKEKKKP